MPIYEYQCGSCGHGLEAFQKMTDQPLTQCPNCHKAQLQKLVSAAGFQLKGTGWYATDFKNKGKAESKKDSKSDSSSKQAAPSSESSPDKKDKQTDTGTSTSTGDK